MKWHYDRSVGVRTARAHIDGTNWRLEVERSDSDAAGAAWAWAAHWGPMVDRDAGRWWGYTPDCPSAKRAAVDYMNGVRQ